MDPLTELHREQAHKASDRGDFAESSRQWRVVVQRTPTDAVAQHNLAVALRDSGELEQAEASYKRAAKLDPALAEAQYGLALVCQKTQRWDEMVDHCRQAERLRPGWQSPLFGLMLACAEKAKATGRADDWCAALEAVDYGLATRPDLIRWRSERAYALWRLDRGTAAIQEMEALVTAEPTYDRYIWLAYYQLRCGQWRGWWRTQRILFPKVWHRVGREQERAKRRC